jgi:UDPglucose 6-dehydrogenase
MLLNLKETRIGIIGGGVVGTATARSWVEHVKEVKVFDIDPKRATHSLKDTLDSDFVLICLPTPKKPHSRECDTSTITNFFKEVDGQELLRDIEYPVFVIKSTVPIGFTRELALGYNWDYPIIHSPEFLTARCSLIDAQIPSRNIVGTPQTSTNDEVIDWGTCWGNTLAERFPQTPLLSVTSSESEMIKLVCNSFFAAKITFFNEIYRLISRTPGVLWNNVLEGVLMDGRISPSHTQVPGPDHKFGYGGECLPKDLNNLASCFQERVYGGSPFLELIDKLNNLHRSGNDGKEL